MQSTAKTDSKMPSALPIAKMVASTQTMITMITLTTIIETYQLSVVAIRMKKAAASEYMIDDHTSCTSVESRMYSAHDTSPPCPPGRKWKHGCAQFSAVHLSHLSKCGCTDAGPGLVSRGMVELNECQYALMPLSPSGMKPDFRPKSEKSSTTLAYSAESMYLSSARRRSSSSSYGKSSPTHAFSRLSRQYTSRSWTYALSLRSLSQSSTIAFCMSLSSLNVGS
mmetsp:Transcript_19466/g.50226  ORF Transcript_19466/g.50226 Transcript_19466/m.50226 type:complete len:224 (-) Transcript_19466:374-1045(-)